jgi:hypothetical protein
MYTCEGFSLLNLQKKLQKCEFFSKKEENTPTLIYFLLLNYCQFN